MTEQAQHSLPVPLLLPTLAWCTGICLAAFLQIPIFWLILAGVAGIVTALIFRFRLPFLIVLFLIASALRLSLAVNDKPNALRDLLQQKESITQPFTAEVKSVLNPEHTSYSVNLLFVNQVPVKGKAYFYCSKSLLPGDRFQALGTITLNKPDPALGNTSFYDRQRAAKIPFRISSAYKIQPLSHPNKFNLERLRFHLLENLDAKLGPSAPFAKALLLNDRTEDRDWIQQLVQGGLLHLIAISGMNVVFLYFVLVTLFGIFIPRKWSEVLFIVLMLIYAGLCQWSPPVMRAIIMILLYLFAKWLQKPVAPLQIICLSLLLITAFDPVQLFSVGLQLSYLCVLALLYLIPKRNEETLPDLAWKRKLQQFWLGTVDTVASSAIIALVMLPVMFFYFNRGSLNGIIGNLLGLPLISILLPLTLVLLLLPSHLLIFTWLQSCYYVLVYIFQVIVKWTASLPFYIDAVSFPLPWLIATYLILGAVIVRLKNGLKMKRLSYAFLILAIPFAIYALFPHGKPFTLTVFNAGQGDCSLIQYPSGQTLMIDTGPLLRQGQTDDTRSWFGTRTGPWQRHLGLTNIDLLILSHLDADHSGGTIDVFNSMRVRNLMVSRYSYQSKEWQKLQQSGCLKEAKLHVLDDTLSFDFGSSRIHILHPAKNFHASNDNDNSILVRVDYKNWSGLFTGDLTTTAEEVLVNNIPEFLDVDFLKAPHHGSKYSNSADFIRVVSPSQVCITAARHNMFGFPHPDVLKRYRNFGIEPQLTGNGSVIVRIP